MLDTKKHTPPVGIPSSYRINGKRRFVQAFFLLLYFVFPFLGLFYLNLSAGSFVLLGKTIGIGNSVIFLIGMIALLLGVITMAITTGRSFCGWVCPQNFLSEVVNSLIGKFARNPAGKNKFIPYAVITSGTILISIAVAINFMFYFGTPAEISGMLVSGELNGTVATFALLFGLLVFAGIGIYRHDFCKYACPYGIMQAAVADKTTLRVRFAKERSQECINCGDCTSVCYMGIEPRMLVQADPGCMNCGLCVEACHQVLEPLGVNSMLDFTAEKDQEKENLNGRALAILLPSLIIFSLWFAYQFFTLPTVDLMITRNDTHVSKLDDSGNISSKYFIQLVNQTAKEQDIILQAQGLAPGEVIFSDPVVTLKPGVKLKLEFIIKTHKSRYKPGAKKFQVIAFNKSDNKLIKQTESSLFIPL